MANQTAAEWVELIKRGNNAVAVEFFKANRREPTVTKLKADVVAPSVVVEGELLLQGVGSK